MAGNFEISISSEQAAKDWLAQVQQINEEFKIAMEEAGKILEAANEAAEGEIIDDLVNLGTNICQAGQLVFEAVDSISDTVADVLSKLGNFIDESKNAIKKAFAAFGK